MVKAIRYCLPTAITLSMVFCGSASAVLIGDTVNCNITGGGSFGCSPGSAVVGAGPEFNVGLTNDPFIGVDLAAESITLDILQDNELGGTIINLTDLDWIDRPGEIVGLSLSNNGINGLTLGDLSFGTNNISIDLRNTNSNAGAFALIDIDVRHVPEPFTILGTFSAIGIGAILKNKKLASLK